MSLLPGYLLLLVAEQAGFAEIQALRATCKFNRSLLDRYEHSVTKANTSRYPYTPCNHILASDTREREVLPLDTFDTIRELQTRQHNIDELVNGDFRDFLAFWDQYDLDDPSKADFIRGSLRNALWRCSEMADLETHSIQYRDDVVPKRDPCVKSLIHQDLILRDAPPPDGWHLALQEVHESNRQDVRLRQIAHIRECLGASELAGILVLAHLATQGHIRNLKTTPARARHEIVEMGVCMAENVMRHGVFFLHAQVKGGENDAHDHAKLLLDDTFEEMRRWENGDPRVMAGLSMTVVSRFCEVVGCERRDYLTAACALVRGDVWKKEEDEEESEDAELEKDDDLPEGEGVDLGEMA